MKAEELMIGDWVLYTEFGRNKKCKVEILEPNRVWLNGCRTYVPIEFIEPIQLKPEILALNGFSLLEQTRTYKVFTLREEDELSIQVDFFGKDSRIIVRIEKYNYESKYYMNCLHNCDIKYVHQLQHAMRLCGITKEIKI